jgi:predicted ArsR family transcriptional regulator
MRWWETSIGGAVRGRIIALLRRGEQSVEELAAALDVTDNAVRAQLQILEREGVVRQARVRRTGVVGKPPTTFEIVPDAEALFSTAYAPMLRALLEALEDRLSPQALNALLRDAGARLSASPNIEVSEAAAPDNAPLEARVRAAAAMLASLGADVDVERTDDGFLIRGFACPLSDAVRAQPKTCRAVEALVSNVVGAPVRECCERGASVRCRFEVKKAG